ncbi:MATE family efflux transporter [Sulfitobacter aestuariivivens]|uniref:Multidrug-efflux transporter n=1 Tax=Sulfitobacter aestuariivivens TaxID=2766981 RepID=A0A927D0F8_9RHOB|nr:MATE family efflux transporter [Sulfitobacter aestuariivivens]MBD3662734.1 MATE family efflux transporter [Sulfitobacter aestuariivivens]
MFKQMSYAGHGRAILTLGLPLIGGHLGQTAIGVTDTVMLGWYSVEALAAVTLASSYFFVIFLFGSGFAMAVMPMVASYDAEGDETSIRRATRMGMWLSLGFAVISLPLMIWSGPILLLMGQGDSIAADAARYLRIAAWGIVPALMVMVLKSYLAALERTQIVFWITAGAAICNFLANYALIFGNWGAPELGLQGAALASVITQLVSLIFVVLYLIFVVPQHRLFKRFWRSDTAMLVEVFRLGWPIGLTMLAEVGLFAASALMMGWLGTIPLAAHGIAVQLASITFMVHLGLSNVATIRAGNAYGRRDVPHLARGAGVTLMMSLGFAVLTIIAFVTFPEPLISLFMQTDEPARAEILAIGVGLLVVAALFQLVDGAQAIGLGLLRGVLDTKVPMVLAAISYWIVGIPCSYLLGFTLGFGGIGVWMGLVIGLCLAAVLLNGRFWGITLKRLRSGDLQIEAPG